VTYLLEKRPSWHNKLVLLWISYIIMDVLSPTTCPLLQQIQTEVL